MKFTLILTKFINNPRLYLNNLINEAKQWFIDKPTWKFIKHNQKKWLSWKVKNSDKVILVDFYGVGETLISYSYFLNVLAKKHKAAIISFGESRIIPYRRLHKIFQSFNTLGHLIPFLTKEQQRRQETIYKKIIPSLKTKRDLFNLKVLNTWIGIDIYESYLRDYFQPTVYLTDPRLLEMVKRGIGLLIFWQDYFKQNKVVGVVVSHDSYLHLDTVCKIAYKTRVPVYLPNVRGITYVDKPFSVYSYFSKYPQMFKNNLSQLKQRKALVWAKSRLEKRLKGEVGVDMPYSTKSAFKIPNNPKRVLKETKKIKVLICTHCFYDNPHGYGGMFFVDFYEWLRFLGKLSKKTDYDWYLKVHPDPLPGTLEIIREILVNFPKITIIPHETSHHQLVKEGLDFVLTVYGSVGHEYPALGIRVINAGYNPHISYDFNRHPKSIKEYKHWLLNLDRLKKKKLNRRGLYEFYYLHYYYVLVDDLILKSYRQSLLDLTTRERIGPKIYEYFLSQLTKSKHEAIIKKMNDFINSGKNHYFILGPE